MPFFLFAGPSRGLWLLSSKSTQEVGTQKHRPIRRALLRARTELFFRRDSQPQTSACQGPRKASIFFYPPVKVMEVCTAAGLSFRECGQTGHMAPDCPRRRGGADEEMAADDDGAAAEGLGYTAYAYVGPLLFITICRHRRRPYLSLSYVGGVGIITVFNYYR